MKERSNVSFNSDKKENFYNDVIIKKEFGEDMLFKKDFCNRINDHRDVKRTNRDSNKHERIIIEKDEVNSSRKICNNVPSYLPSARNMSPVYGVEDRRKVIWDHINRDNIWNFITRVKNQQ